MRTTLVTSILPASAPARRADRTEAWISERTGHKVEGDDSALLVAGEHRSAAHYLLLQPLDQAIPELRTELPAVAGPSDRTGKKNCHEASAAHSKTAQGTTKSSIISGGGPCRTRTSTFLRNKGF